MSYIVKLADLPERLDSLDPILDKIVEGDCLELMHRMPDGCVGVIWTDPPYGHSNHEGDWNSALNEIRGLGNRPIENDSQEEMLAVVDGMLLQAARVLKPDCCCCCCSAGGGPTPTFGWLAQRLDRDGLSFFHCVVWDKLNPGLGWRYRRQSEFVMVSHRTGGKLRWADDDVAIPNVYRLFPDRERQHPNQKPLTMVSDFLRWHSLGEDVIFDPFLGSGTTAVAAKKLGRHFIGCEISPDYCKIAERRLLELDAQPGLFEPIHKIEQQDLGLLK